MDSNKDFENLVSVLPKVIEAFLKEMESTKSINELFDSSDLTEIGSELYSTLTSKGIEIFQNLGNNIEEEVFCKV